MSRFLLLLAPALALAACQTLGKIAPVQGGAHSTSAQHAALPDGQFDNHEQVWAARENAVAVMPPHLSVTLETTAQAEWSLWHIHLDATPALDALWALQRSGPGNGPGALLPYRALVAVPATGAAFDPKQWAPLDACALHGNVTPGAVRVAADAAACAALAPGIGALAALLPLAIEREGEWLRLRLYADQARGPDAREDAREVHVFAGWAAINGAGPLATPSQDWHMDRTLRLGSEGGNAALKWRDGKPSGYSLRLERLTYREGNVPVLKLSVIEDADGRTLAYAWANPEATRIGINLGWLQVGLERADGTSAPPLASGQSRQPD